MGFPLFILPAYIVGGAKGVELFLAAIAALAVALAYRLALRVVPDPWAIGAAAVVGLCPPFLAYGTAVYPELTAGAALAGAALLALRLDERPRRREACPLLRAARLPPLARHQVRARGDRHRLRGRARPLARPQAHARHRLRRDLALQRRVLRGHQRGDLRRAHPLRRRPSRRQRHRRRLARRLRGPRLPARGALHRPQRRPAALGPGVPARLRRRLVALAHAPRSPVEGGGRRSPGRAHRRALRDGPGRPLARGLVPRAHDVRLLVPAAPPAGRAPAGDPARRARPAPHAEGRASRCRRSPWSGACGSTPTWGSSAARS